MVQVGGIRAGRVQDVELDDGKVLVTFEVDHGVEFGKDSQASRSRCSTCSARSTST